jgi:polyisoprenoid-binding protein YceI
MCTKYAWTLDPSHSKLAFKVRYMILGVITGEFRHFGGTVMSSDAFEDMELDISVDVRSMNTFHQQRDQGILSAGCFDADSWPVIRFVSTGFRRISSGGLFEGRGLLTIRGIGVPLEMMASLASFNAGAGDKATGAATENNDAADAIFTFSGNLYRSDFGLGGPATPEQDHVADEVNFFGEARLLGSAV